MVGLRGSFGLGVLWKARHQSDPGFKMCLCGMRWV